MNEIVTSQAPSTDDLQAGHVFSLALLTGPGAIVQRLIAGVVVESVPITASASFGPYLHNMQFRVSCIGGGRVATSAAPQTVAQLTAAQMATTQALAAGTGVLWANRPAATLGALQWFSDIGGGTLWRGDAAGNWRVLYPTLIVRNATLLSGINATGEQYLSNLAIPGGMLFAGASIEWKQGGARSDATDATTAIIQRLGPLGTISDPAFGGGLETKALTTTNRTYGLSGILRVTAALTFIREGSAWGGTASYGGAVAGNAFGTATAVQNLAAPIYFGASMQLAAATGTTLPQVTNQELWMLP